MASSAPVAAPAAREVQVFRANWRLSNRKKSSVSSNVRRSLAAANMNRMSFAEHPSAVGIMQLKAVLEELPKRESEGDKRRDHLA